MLHLCTTKVWQNATLVSTRANKCFVWPNSEFEFSTCAQLKFGKTKLKFGKTQLKFGKTQLKFGMSQLKFARVETSVWRFPNHR